VAKYKYTYQQRINACADWLLGLTYDEIWFKHAIPANTVLHWIRRRRDFRLRR
jgi:uncharacterized protein YjcR